MNVFQKGGNAILSVFCVLIFLFSGYIIWNRYGSERASERKQLAEQYRQSDVIINSYETAMKQDRAGGDTPEVTLRLFMNALRNNDAEGANAYFSLETNVQSPSYLLHKEKEWIEKIIREEKAIELANFLSRAVPTINQQNARKGVFWYTVYNEFNVPIHDIEFSHNTYTGVWKIESI